MRGREHRRHPGGRRGAAGLRRRTGRAARAVRPRPDRQAAGAAAGARPGGRRPAAGPARGGTAAHPGRGGAAGPGGSRVPGVHDLVHHAPDRRVRAGGQPDARRAAHRGGAGPRRAGRGRQRRRGLSRCGPRPADRRGPGLPPLDQLDAALADRRGRVHRDPRGLSLGLVPQQCPRCGRPGHCGVHRPEIRPPALVLGRPRHSVGAALQRAGHRPVGAQRAGRHGGGPGHRGRDPDPAQRATPTCCGGSSRSRCCWAPTRPG